MLLITSKRLTHLNSISLSRKIKSLKQNKKAVIEGQRLMELIKNNMKDNKAQALALLDKYMEVLTKIEGDKKKYPKPLNIGKGF